MGFYRYLTHEFRQVVGQAHESSIYIYMTKIKNFKEGKMRNFAKLPKIDSYPAQKKCAEQIEVK